MRKFPAIVFPVAFCAALAAPSFAGPADKQPTPANPLVPVASSRIVSFPHLWHYIDTHKEIPAANAAMIGAWSAGVSSTVYGGHGTGNTLPGSTDEARRKLFLIHVFQEAS